MGRGDGEQSGTMSALRPQPQAAPRTAASRATPSQGGAAITLRAVLGGAALIPVNAWWLIETEYIRYADNGTTSALFFNAVSLVLLLLLLNGLLARVRPRWRFTSAELVVIYVAVSVATNLAGHDQLQILF